MGLDSKKAKASKAEPGRDPRELASGFARMGKYPQAEMDIMRLGKDILTAADSAKIRPADLVAHCCELMEFCPTLAQLKSAAMLVKDDRPPLGCRVCRLDDEPRTKAPRHNDHPTMRQVGVYDCGVRCECERGKWFAARDARRDRQIEKAAAGRDATGARRQIQDSFEKIATGDEEL